MGRCIDEKLALNWHPRYDAMLAKSKGNHGVGMSLQ